MKKIIIIFLIIIFGIFFYKITSKKPDSNTSNTTIQPVSELTLFFGITCPHCEKVEEFIVNNKIDQKLKINKLEVYEDKTNAAIFASSVNKVCSDKLDPQGLPVPFLIDPQNQQCIVGDQPVIDYLSKKTN